MNNSVEMPKYKCHKEVHALKIAEIQLDSVKAAKENRDTDGSAKIVPVEEGYIPFLVSSNYLKRHNPEVGGYYVVYEDNYISYSPAKAFEAGYTKL